MRRHGVQGRTKLIRTVSLVLLTLACFSALVRAQTTGPSLESGGPRHEAAAPNPANLVDGVPAIQANKNQPVPDAAPYPFLRLIGVLLSGLVISAARLARKFRRFWGLGVFANPYAILFVIFGVGLCGIPFTSEGALTSRLGILGVWLADLSGIVLALIVPAIRLRPQARPATDSGVRDLEGTSSSNPILAVIEDAIRDRILARLQSEVVAASRRYGWETIKLAARRTLEEEMTIGRLRRQEGDAARQAIEALQFDKDAGLDSNRKYIALVRLLQWCSFSRVRDGLIAAARETQP